jgi:hypothetical protein
MVPEKGVGLGGSYREPRKLAIQECLARISTPGGELRWSFTASDGVKSQRGRPRLFIRTQARAPSAFMTHPQAAASQLSE